MKHAIVTKFFALLLLCALAGAASRYPGNGPLLGLALAGYAALLWLRPAAWLLVIPALLPVLDLAPWTGWFYIEELDLLLLATAAILYWRIGAAAATATLPAAFTVALGLSSVAWAIAAWIGFLPAQAFSTDALASYNSAWNSLRVAKGLAWALVLLPLLRISAGLELINLRRYFVPGMLIGLAGACLSILWERAVFPGLFNFASDYRPTGMFSAMHTGGAALDAYLAISFPFVAFLLTGAQTRRALVAGLVLLLLGAFAGMAIFSRDIYLAYGGSAALLGLLALARSARAGTLRWRRLAGLAAILALLAYALFQVFASGGYRTLAAALGVLGATVILGGAGPRRTRIPLFAACALALALSTVLLFVFVRSGTGMQGIGKGPYLAFIVTAAVFAGASLVLFFGPAAQRDNGFSVAGGAFPCVALCTALVAWHWGGSAALADCAQLIALAFALLALNRTLPQPLWRTDRAALTVTLSCAIVLAILVPMTSSYYMGSRFSTTSEDLSTRQRHWSEALNMMTPDLFTSLFGMGLGTYTETYAWRNTHGEGPGSLSYKTEGSNQFLRLSGAQYAIGFGEALRTLQQMAPSETGRYQLSLDVRRTRGDANLAISVCERWMLYPQNCGGGALQLAPADGAWHHYALEFGQPSPPGAPQLLRPPVQLEMSTRGAHASVDVDNLSVRDARTGAELLRNGSFSNGFDYWFFSSDRNHLPYHVKNFFVNTFFEQGWFGLAATALLLAIAATHLALRAVRGEAGAGIYLAAMAGFMLVGLFDSLFDVPRLTLLFFLVLGAAMLTPRARARRRRHARPGAAQRQDGSSIAP